MTRGWDRWVAAVAAGDRDAIPAFYASSYQFVDRRRLFRMTLDRGETLVNDRFLLEGRLRPARTLLATAGDRFALQHILWTAGEEGGTSEVEILMVTEVDGEGRFVAGVAFDPADRAAASAELFERWVASGADGMPDAANEFVRASHARDLARVRAVLHDDFVFHDRRRTGVGRVEGADAYLPVLGALLSLVPEMRVDSLYFVTAAPHGRVAIGRTWGTNAEGGQFESVYASLIHFRSDLVAGIELFEPEDLDQAVARLEELRAQIGPSAAAAQSR